MGLLSSDLREPALAGTAPPQQRQPDPQPHSQPAICPTDSDTIVPPNRGAAAAAAAAGRRADRTLDKQSWEYILKSGVAGGVAGCAAKTIVGPLDRVKILFQASNPAFRQYSGSWTGVGRAMRAIVRADGPAALFRGHSATLLRIFPYAGIKFLAYEQIRAGLIPDRAHETAARRFAAGSLAGCVSVFFTYPLEVLRVRLAFETGSGDGAGRPTLWRAAERIYSERPVTSTTTTTTTTAATHPQPSTLLTHTPRPIAGISNFYRGFSATMYGMLPYAGSSFLAHDTITDWFRHPAVREYTTVEPRQADHDRSDRPAQLKHWAQLFAGGCAGFVSQSVSYPFEVVRRRMQVGAVVGDGHRLTIAEVARLIYTESGPRGFFVGLTIGYVKVVPLVAVSFYVYDRMKRWLGI